MILALLEENSLSALFSTLEQVRVESIRDGLYEVSFTDVLPSRRLIYPCDYQLEPELILALEEAIQSIHDSGCYADVVPQWTYRDSEGNLDTTLSRYCYIATDQFRYALDEDGIAKALSNKDNSFVFADQWALYSVEAQWGLHVMEMVNTLYWLEQKSL